MSRVEHIGDATRFKPGDEPWNKGRKGLHLSPRTEWKKGCESNRKMPIGSETIRRCKNGKMRAFVKVAEPNIWRERAKVIWEASNGPLQKGFVVHHKDRDALNDSIYNLQALTRAGHLAEHRRDWRK